MLLLLLVLFEKLKILKKDEEKIKNKIISENLSNPNKRIVEIIVKNSKN